MHALDTPSTSKHRHRSAHNIRMAVAGSMLALLLIAPVRTSAQESVYRISQRATLSQKLGKALISLDYSRPLVRNRTELFGNVVHWGELWTPGANEATVLEVSEEVKLNGKAVPAGRWSLWVIPSRVGPWEMVLDAKDSLFHTQRPELKGDQIRFPLEVHEDGPFTEALNWSFPEIAQNGGTLRMNWDRIRIDMKVEVDSPEPVTTVSAGDAARYVGDWRLEIQPNPAMGDQVPPPMPINLSHGADGRLYVNYPPGVFTPPAGPEEPAVDEATLSPQERERAHARRLLAEENTSAIGEGSRWRVALVPKAPDIFRMAWFEYDVLLDIEAMYHEFEVENGRAVRMTMRDDKDNIIARATRAQ